MRLFVALDIDDAIRERIVRLVEGVGPFAPDARWVKPESMHVTLKFIGERADDTLVAIKQALAQVTASTIKIDFRGYGFFPTPKSARVFWIGMEAGPELGILAAAVDKNLSLVGIAKEDRPFSPHLTLARSAGGSGSPRGNRGHRPEIFQILQNRLSALPVPEFGTMTSREFFLYQSQLSPKGSKYTKLAKFELT
ncbi:MAG TPA: RNA 2',3'-cyclic phosphodiesterase [Candidatus Eisenbacteria bacterium]|nr:RNA 2',3'-cyclic phosphodiesterase [Candidatus Eisenbacteria bacterium]